MKAQLIIKKSYGDLQVVEQDENGRVKIHYIGWPKYYDEWKNAEEVAEKVHCPLLKASSLQDRKKVFLHHLLFSIKNALYPTLKSDPVIRIETPIDNDLWEKVAEIMDMSSKAQRKADISNTALTKVFGDTTWWYRIYNSNFDYCYVIDGTFVLKILKRALTEYKIKGDDGLTECIRNDCLTCVCTFVRGNGNHNNLDRIQK